MKNFFVKWVQVASYPFLHLYFKFFFSADTYFNIDYNKGEKYIFAPNHQRYIDPFIIFYSLSFEEVYPLLPLRFMATPNYMKKFFIGSFLRMLGCYDSSEDSLDKSIDLLSKGNSVCIFPQGKFDIEHKERARVGVVYVQREVKGSIIVPINVEYSKKGVKIIFIKKINTKKFPKNLQLLADKVLKSIKDKK